MIKDVENPVVPWSGRGHHYTEKEIQAVVDAMQTCDPLAQGAKQAEFQAAFQDYVGGGPAFATTSCSSALELCRSLIGLGPDDEVIIPGHTFAATAIPLARGGSKIVWSDIDPDTRVVSAESIAKCLTARTKAIVVVHLYGLMADMDPIMDIARERGILVIEDCAQAPGASYKGKKAGSIGDLACFSFHSHKNMTTLGEGGMLVVNREELLGPVAGLRHHGMCGFSEPRPNYWTPAMGNVDLDLEGVWPAKHCLSEVQCALGNEVLKRLDDMNAERRRRAEKLQDALAPYSELTFQQVPEGRTHVYHLLAAQYRGDGGVAGRDAFIERMAFHHRVKVIVQYNPLYRYPLFQKFGFGEADCPYTDAYYDSMVSFPFHHGLTDEQLDYMTDAVSETCEILRKGGQCVNS